MYALVSPHATLQCSKTTSYQPACLRVKFAALTVRLHQDSVLDIALLCFVQSWGNAKLLGACDQSMCCTVLQVFCQQSQPSGYKSAQYTNALFMFAGFSTGIKWAVSLDSTPASAQAHSLAAGRPISCAIPGSTVFYRLPSGLGVHQHSCGLPIRYAGTNHPPSRGVPRLAPFCKGCPDTHTMCLCVGGWSFYAAWIYGSLCMATFIVRTMKRVLFREARQYSECYTATLSLLVQQTCLVTLQPLSFQPCLPMVLCCVLVQACCIN